MLVYVENCIFVHMTDKIFPVPGPPSETHAPKVEVLEPHLVKAKTAPNFVPSKSARTVASTQIQ